jgi:uncharacterized protein
MPNYTDVQRIQQVLRQEKPHLQKHFGIVSIGVFGSLVRGEQTLTSDIDILIEYDAASSLSVFDGITIEKKLSHLLGRNVDIVTLPALKKHIGERILREVQFV